MRCETDKAEALVSVVVPVYNSEKNLEKCIESILQQTWENLEIILVDDGSTDNSPVICDELHKRDIRIHVIHQKNQGVSCARNVGLECANGEYIAFVDSDDELSVDSIQVRVRGIGETDLLVAGYDVFSFQNEKKYSIDSYEYRGCTQVEMLGLMFGEHSCGYQGYLWNKLFKMKIIRENGLKFRENIHYNEDRLFIVQYLKKSSQVSFVNMSVYCYKINPTGAMESTKKFSDAVYKKWITEFTAYRIMREELREYNSEIYALCSIDAMRSAIVHKQEMTGRYTKEKKYFSKCIREFSCSCIFGKNLTFKQRLKFLGHYILAR